MTSDTPSFIMQCCKCDSKTFNILLDSYTMSGETPFIFKCSVCNKEHSVRGETEWTVNPMEYESIYSEDASLKKREENKDDGSTKSL